MTDEHINARFNRLEELIEQFSRSTDSNFHALSERIDWVETDVSTLKTDVSQLQADVSEMKQTLNRQEVVSGARAAQ